MLDSKLNSLKRALVKMAHNSGVKDSIINMLMEHKTLPLLRNQKEFDDLELKLKEPVHRIKLSEQMSQNKQMSLGKTISNILGMYFAFLSYLFLNQYKNSNK